MKSAKNRAFTLIELLVVIAIISLLAALIMPVVTQSIARGRSVQCLNSMRQLGSAAMLFASDHGMTLPVTVHQRQQGGQSWTLSLQAYAGGKIVFRCPVDENRTRTYTYVLNDFLTPHPAGAPDLNFSRLSVLDRPGSTVLFTEATAGYAGSDHFHFADYRGQPMPGVVFADQVAVERHVGSANYVFADGHAVSLRWADAQARLAEPGSRFIDPTAEIPSP